MTQGTCIGLTRMSVGPGGQPWSIGMVVGQASRLSCLEKKNHTRMKTPELTIYRRKLPHWRMQGCVYFLTWRLAMAQPALNPEERTLVAEAIGHFDGRRYHMLAYVVMDDHVRALVLTHGNRSLEQIVHSWKSFTAKRLRTLGQRAVPVWQDEYFDRIVRDETELIQRAQYLLGNPVKRWPDTEEYPWAGLGSWNG